MAGGLSLLAGGCSGSASQRANWSAGAYGQAWGGTRGGVSQWPLIVLAANETTPGDAERKQRGRATSRPSSDQGPTTRSKAKPKPYTTPLARLLLMAIAAPDDGKSAGAAGKEAAENSVGKPQLGGSHRRVAVGEDGSIGNVFRQIGRDGLQRGPPLMHGLPFNIFRPRRNSVETRCRELVTAGFFTTQAVCRDRFAR